MNILITGATGFIGQTLCRVLGGPERHALTALSRRPDQARTLLGPNVAVFRDARELLQCCPEASFDAVINLAGAPIGARRWTSTYKRELIDSRVKTTQDIVWLCGQLAALPGVVISGSAMGFYGNKHQHTVTEDTPPRDDFAHRLCQSWEASAAPLQAMGIRLVTLRIGLVLGASGGMLKAMLPAFRAGLGARIGAGHNMMPWVLLDDVVRAIGYMLTECDIDGPVNMSAPTPVSQRDFMAALGAAVKRPVWLRVPEMAAWAALGERASLLTTSVDMRPEKLLRYGFAFSALSLPSALTRALA